ncbi:MAG: outer membrane beta-barrel protein [Rickettsiaceae bacterium]|nr:outer membrane beta-barrel protein [Rickettsiaceae bacterium]
MLKTIFSTAAIIAALTSSAYAEEAKFYAKGQIGWNKLDNIKSGSATMKSSNSIFLGLGLGYYVIDNVRADLTFDHYVNPVHKGITQRKFPLKYKSQANTIMLNGFVDLFDVKVAKIFAGAGVGMSMLSAKTSLTLPSGRILNDKAKESKSFAYALHLGGSTELAPALSVELSYSYRQIGKFKKSQKRFSLGSLKGHHVAAGVRYDI